MLIIQRESTDPYFDRTTEEFLVKTLEEPCFMLLQNSPSVIMGKHQNPLKEVNLAYLNQHQIPINIMKNFYDDMSGYPRMYVDNTIDFIKVSTTHNACRN